MKYESMIKFDLNRFLKDKRFSHTEAGKILGRSQRSISYMVERGTVKPNFLRQLEGLFGDCSKYITEERIST